MNRQDRIREARQRTGDAAVAVAAFDAAKADATAATEKSIKEINAFRKRQATILVDLAGQKSALGFGDLYVNYGAPEKAKEITEQLIAGALKVSPGNGNGTAYSVKGLAQRIRVPDKAGLAAIAKATKAHERAVAASARAWQLQKDAINEAYALGAKVTPDQVIDVVVKGQVIRGRRPRGAMTLDQWTRERLVREMTEATAHELAARANVECQCSTCGAERDKAAKAEVEAARVKALPSVMFECPEHGRKRCPTERKERFVDADKVEPWGLAKQGWQLLPLVYCPVDGKAFIHTPTIKADAKARAKAEAVAKRELAKAAKRKRPAKTDDVEVDDAIAFTCPECGEVNANSRVLIDDNDGILYAECESCEDGIALDDLTFVRLQEAA